MLWQSVCAADLVAPPAYWAWFRGQKAISLYPYVRLIGRSLEHLLATLISMERYKAPGLLEAMACHMQVPEWLAHHSL